jgi:hypothetical protein
MSFEHDRARSPASLTATCQRVLQTCLTPVRCAEGVHLSVLHQLKAHSGSRAEDCAEQRCDTATCVHSLTVVCGAEQACAGVAACESPTAPEIVDCCNIGLKLPAALEVCCPAPLVTALA